MRLILGIDPGLARTGWGIVSVRKQQLELRDYGVIITKSSLGLSYRLIHLHQQLLKLIQSHSLAEVAIEKLFFGKNAKTAMLVGEARGVIVLTLCQSQLPILEFTPAEVKIALTGYGNADKHQMQEMVKQTLGLKKRPTPDDAADALAVAITAAVTKNHI